MSEGAEAMSEPKPCACNGTRRDHDYSCPHYADRNAEAEARELDNHLLNHHLGHLSDFCDECQRLLAAILPTSKGVDAMEDENKTLVVAEATTGDGAAPAATEPEPQTDEADGLDLRKVAVGIYNVWLTTGDNAKRIGTVGRIGSGEWVAYSITGHAGKERYATRRDAAEALAAGRR